MKMASRLIDLISKKKKKNKLHVKHTFSSNLQKTNLHVQLSYVLVPNILYAVFMFALIFHCRSFSACWPLAFLIFSPPL